jgi:hypothetical protein
MSRYTLRLVLGVWILLAGNCAGEVVNLSGTWKLNIEKSKWGKVPKPVSIVVTVVHKEPALNYTGKIVQMEGEVQVKSLAPLRSVPGRLELRRLQGSLGRRSRLSRTPSQTGPGTAPLPLH